VQVYIPYQSEIVKNFPRDKERYNSDIKMVLKLIEMHAQIFQFQRKPDEQGRVVATLDDYKVIYALKDLLISSISISPHLKKYLECLKEFDDNGKQPSKKEIADKLKLEYNTISRYTTALKRKGLIETDGKGQKLQIKLISVPEDISPLVDPEKISGIDFHSQIPNSTSALQPQAKELGQGDIPCFSVIPNSEANTEKRKNAENGVFPVETVDRVRETPNTEIGNENTIPPSKSDLFTPDEEQKLQGFNSQTKETVRNVKKVFGSTAKVVDSYIPKNTPVFSESPKDRLCDIHKKEQDVVGCLACLIDIGRVMPGRGGKPIRNLLNVVNKFTSLDVQTLEDFRKIPKTEAKEIINFLGLHQKDTILHFFNKNNISQTENNGT